MFGLRKNGGGARLTYSQAGEDFVIYSALQFLLQGKRKPTYLDIGANDPKNLSNTFLLYKNGSHGILVEPNIDLCNKLKKVRRKDIVLNCGVAEKHGMLTYYIMNSHTLNTFYKEEAEFYEKQGRRILEEKQVEVITINEIFEKYGNVDFLSIDAEGMDFEIIKSIDFERYLPLVICLETQVYRGMKRDDFGEINNFLAKKGYMVYGDTMLNTIYVNRKAYISIFENVKK